MPKNAHKIPVAVAAFVNDVISGSHKDLERLFRRAGAPGEPPDLSHASKWKQWLLAANHDPQVDPYVVLGGVLEEFMEAEPGPNQFHGREDERAAAVAKRVKDRLHLRQLLARYGLTYRQGGRIISGDPAAPTRSLESVLHERDIAALDIEFQRALENVESDPPAAITSACAIMEALCKVYIEDEQIETPSEQTIKPLWKAVQKHLGLDPAQLADDDLKRVLTGLSSIVDGIGAFRTHVGSAHGRGRAAYRPAPRHARLAVNSAHSLVVFVLETWDARKAAEKLANRALQSDGASFLLTRVPDEAL
jgi:hypothetical protein